MRFYSTICTEKHVFSAIFFLAFQLLTLQLTAQSESFSPYSRYGIGDIPFNGFARNIGMGGIGMAERPLFNVNMVNPASYSSLLITEFDVAVTSTFARLSTANLTQKKSGTTFSYFALGFPVVNKKWGAALGLVPFSNVGYKMVSPETDPVAGGVNFTYEGTGGINRVFLGNAVTIKKNFSVGFNASYLFGSIDRISTTEFSEANFFNSRFTSNTIIRDFYFDFGLQYVFDSLKMARSDSLVMYDNRKKNLKDSIGVFTDMVDSLSGSTDKDAAGIKLQLEELRKNITELNTRISQADSARREVNVRRQKSDWSLTGGFTFALPANISASQDSLVERYLGTVSSNFITIRDTVLQKEDDKGTIRFPLTLGFGLALKKGTQWLIGIDASMQSWDDYSYFGQQDSLRNSWRVSTGFQYTPNDRVTKPYWSLMQYRFGAFYNKTYLQLKGTQLNEYGLTAGLGLPILAKGTSFATIQIGAAFGTRGTTDNNLLKEDFARVSIGVTFSDRWFIKPKFD